MSSPFLDGLPLPFGDPATLTVTTTAQLVDTGAAALEDRRRVVINNIDASVKATLYTDSGKTKPFLDIPAGQAVVIIASDGQDFYIAAASSISVYCYESKA